jgi:RHS repeat-associated protein
MREEQKREQMSGTLSAPHRTVLWEQRMYDSTLGRFLQRDPVGFDGLYAYGGDSPANWFDPSGLQQKSPQEIWGLIKQRYDEEEFLRWVGNLPGGRLANLLAPKPENRASYKELKKAFDEIRENCKKAPGLPPVLPCPSGRVISLEPMIKDLIRKLGDLSFDVRQAASESLARILPFAVGALREAEKNSKDPEVVLRAERLLKTFEANCVDYQFRQALQGVPPKFKSRLLEMITRDPSALPDSRTIAEILIEQGTPRPPPQPPPMPGPVMPGPAMPPPPNRGPFV